MSLSMHLVVPSVRFQMQIPESYCAEAISRPFGENEIEDVCFPGPLMLQSSLPSSKLHRRTSAWSAHPPEATVFPSGEIARLVMCEPAQGIFISSAYPLTSQIRMVE